MILPGEGDRSGHVTALGGTVSASLGQMKAYSEPKAEFLTCGITDTLNQTILCHGHCPLDCRMFNSTLGLYSLEAITLPPVVAVEDVYRHCHTPFKGNTAPC